MAVPQRGTGGGASGKGQGPPALPVDAADSRDTPPGDGGRGDKDFGVGEAIGFGWEAWKRHTGLLIAAAAVVFLVQAVPQAVSDRLREGQPAAAAFVSVAGWLASQFVSLGFLAVALRVCDGRIAELGGLFRQRDRFLPFVLGSLLYGLLCLAGLALLVVPGIYVAVTFGFYGFSLADGADRTRDAMRQSAALTRGRKWGLLWLWAALLGINFLGALPCGLGLLATIPVSLVALAYAFRRLQGIRPQPAW
jgi:hypothetical protein